MWETEGSSDRCGKRSGLIVGGDHGVEHDVPRAADLLLLGELRLVVVVLGVRVHHRTRTTDLPRVRRWSMSTSALPSSSREYVAPIGGFTAPASIIGSSASHCWWR